MNEKRATPKTDELRRKREEAYARMTPKAPEAAKKVIIEKAPGGTREIALEKKSEIKAPARKK